MKYLRLTNHCRRSQAPWDNAMSETKIIIVLLAVLLVHFVFAVVVVSQISKVVSRRQKIKNNRYASKKINELERYRVLALFAPIFGPIVAYGILKGINPGISEKGYMANNPNSPNVNSEGD
jgi:uncharacterized membrane protein